MSTTEPTGIVVEYLPDGAQLRSYLSMTATTPDVDALLQQCCDVAASYELHRLSEDRMRDVGADPPNSWPIDVAHAILMRSAGMFRRRNSVNGFEGFGDLGALAVRSSDPDIERLVDPFRRWAFA